MVGVQEIEMRYEIYKHIYNFFLKELSENPEAYFLARKLVDLVLVGPAIARPSSQVLKVLFGLSEPLRTSTPDCLSISEAIADVRKKIIDENPAYFGQFFLSL